MVRPTTSFVKILYPHLNAMYRCSLSARLPAVISDKDHCTNFMQLTCYVAHCVMQFDEVIIGNAVAVR